MRYLFYYLMVYLILSLSGCQKAPPISSEVKAAGYDALIGKLESVINTEVEQKDLPGLTIALVDGQTLAYAAGFGFQDAAKKVPASMHTIYRIGSVSKLFTDIAIMQEVEAGNIDLDTNIKEYLPDFNPKNPFGKKISLRQLMSHRAGLVREPPVGHYFDDTELSLEETVRSLNDTELVYEPEVRTKYSNAGIAVVGYVLEKMKGKPFAQHLQARLLEPLDMDHSAFAPNEHIKSHLAEATMWTYDGRDFPAPTFELGMAPAGSMYSSVEDLSRFMKVIFEKGKLPHGGRMLQAKSLEAMWQPQYAKAGETTGYGLGFSIGELDGNRMIGHGGAIYGFSTEIAMLPDKQLGVIVVTSRDFSNSVVERISEYALQLTLAQKEGKALPDWERTQPVGQALARKVAGRYQLGENYLDLHARGDRLYSDGGSYRLELRKGKEDELIVDDRLSYGNSLSPTTAGDITSNGQVIKRVDYTKPPALSQEEKAYIGEYGWDYNTLYILERFGKLHVLIEWFPMYPISASGKDQFDFPDYGLYHGEGLAFERDEKGKIRGVRAAGIFFERRLKNIADGKTFQIKPIRPTDELREIALKAEPPVEEGEYKASDLVDLASLDPSIKYDIRYASDNNFMGIPFYQQSKAYMQRPAAEAVVRIHQRLKEKGYGLLIHDAYRPWYVTKMFWDATPEESKHFVANPQNGSRHNRGCAVDLTLYELATGKVVETVGGYDEMSPRSYPDYPGGTDLQRYYREMLREAMEADGFTVYRWEWWHFDFKDWKSYRIQNLRFEELE